MINYIFTFCTANILSFFSDVMNQFEHLKHKFRNLTRIYDNLSSFQITYGFK